LKKSNQKTFAPAGVCAGIAYNRHRSGDYRQSRRKRPQEQSLFASFSSEKEGLYFGRLSLNERHFADDAAPGRVTGCLRGDALAMRRSL